MTKLVPVFALAAVVLSGALPAAAQTDHFALTLGGAGTVTDAAGRPNVSAGGFLEGALTGQFLGGYFGGTQFRRDRYAAQAGVKFLGPPGWIVRPVARFGGLFDGGATFMTFGGGVEVGREFGAVLTLDMTAVEEQPAGIFHLGVYWRVPF